MFVEIDYTAQAVVGLKRDKVLCRYYMYGGRTELVSITLGNRDHSPRELFGVLGNFRAPSHLSSTYMIAD
ncbi:hypothetical protein D3C86_2020720 [compost metagenome]